ncbi:MAG: DNA internalization-related competence protein ComEC/Rec2 [Bacteroidetes bacterium]|nr:DNA internalization-related competence protein ComEC/Rec2 [Bacteroidota bacterium]
MLKQRPALRFVLLFAAGIFLSDFVILPLNCLLVFIAVLVFLSALFFRFRNQFAAVIILYCSVIFLGILLHSIRRSGFESLKLNPQADDEYMAAVGIIDSEPVHNGKKISCVVCTDSIYRFQFIDTKPRRIMVRFRLNEEDSSRNEIAYGREIRFYGRLDPFPFQRNPGEFDYGKYLASNDIHGIVSVKGLYAMQIFDSSEGNIFQSSLHALRHSLYDVMDSLHHPRHAGFLKGIIFGYRSDISPDVEQAFFETGTIHILAVSGSNVAFVALIFYTLFGFFRVSRRITAGAAILGLIIYMLVTGSSPSVVRATIMAIIILCGTLFERKTDIYNSVGAAALILLIWDTNTLFDIGFQLSFSAVISIVYFYPRLTPLIDYIPERFRRIKAIDAGFKLFAVSLAAQLGTIPFIVYYFNRVSIISFIANIPVVPAAGVNTFIGAVEIMAYPFSSFIAKLYASANDLLVWFLLGFVKKAASVSFASVETWHVPSVLFFGYYLAIFGVFKINSPRFKIRAFITVLVLCSVFFFSRLWDKQNPILTADFIDVGQGDSILLEFPNGKRMLVDAGPSSTEFDAGERTVKPFLKRKGVDKLDYLLITHSHRDHIGGAESILKSFKVDSLVIAAADPEDSLVNRTFQAARAGGTGLKYVFAGEQIQIDTNARVYVLYPNQDRCEVADENNASIVLKIQYGKTSLLLTGDAEKEDEEWMISRYGGFLSNDILKVGHHGSNTSTGEDFLNIVKPEMAVISVGVHNQFRCPSPNVIQRLISGGIEIERTDKSGAVILESDGSRWVQVKWR